LGLATCFGTSASSSEIRFTVSLYRENDLLELVSFGFVVVLGTSLSPSETKSIAPCCGLETRGTEGVDHFQVCRGLVGAMADKDLADLLEFLSAKYLI
jgi:hypothetical protein